MALSDTTIRGKLEPGRYGDGGGLYLQVGPKGGKSWLFRFKVDGKSREMGLGPYPDCSLKEARDKAAECRRLRAGGADPIIAREAERERARLEAARAVTFKACCEAYIGAHEAGWRNPKHRQQWRNTLATYAYPTLGELSVQSVDVALVMKVLEQAVPADGGDDGTASLWSAKPETAGRLRGRIEAVLDWAAVRGYREGENPARWRGRLDKLLPKRSKVRAVEHHAALPFDEMNGFLQMLRGRGGVAALAFEFLILTAARTGEVIGARWPEIDIDEKVWTIPAERMKAKKEHRVPLPSAAVAVLEGVQPLRREDDFVFPGAKKGKPLSNMAFLKLLERMDRADLTAHGFRSSFRDWAAERTSFPREVVEMALAHSVGDKVEAAYRRGDLFDKRRRLMDTWAKHCDLPARRGKVVQLAAAAAQ